MRMRPPVRSWSLVQSPHRQCVPATGNTDVLEALVMGRQALPAQTRATARSTRRDAKLMT
jgi:hypothetical protein